jgi:hypothetical protein
MEMILLYQRGVGWLKLDDSADYAKTKAVKVLLWLEVGENS